MNSCEKLNDPETSAIADSIRPFLAKGEFSGAVTLVTDKNRILHIQAHGESDLAGHVPMKPDSLFWIASMTKPIVGTAFMMVQEEGKLSVNDEVAKFIPEFKTLKTPSGKPANLTLRHLLTHTSGLSEATPDENRAAKNLSDLVPIYLSRPLKMEPETQWIYSQSSINTAAHIIEIVTGQPFADFLQERIFKPLEMKDTAFYLSSEQARRLAKSYEKMSDGTLKEIPVWILDGHSPTFRDRYPAANGGLFSTAEDYGKFCQMILNRGLFGGRRYIREESLEEMTRLHTGNLKSGFFEGSGWGLAWNLIVKPQGISERLSTGSYGHEGAFGTQGWIDPVRGLGYVFLIQRPKSFRPFFQAFLEGAHEELVIN